LNGVALLLFKNCYNTNYCYKLSELFLFVTSILIYII